VGCYCVGALSLEKFPMAEMVYDGNIGQCMICPPWEIAVFLFLFLC